MTALICGSRFGRGLVLPGGVGFDMTRQDSDSGRKACPLAKGFDSRRRPVVEDTLRAGPLRRYRHAPGTNVQELGMVGVPARACGVETDCRFNFPAGIYRFAQIHVPPKHGRRFCKSIRRWLEVQRSIAFIRDQLEALPTGGSGRRQNRFHPISSP